MPFCCYMTDLVNHSAYQVGILSKTGLIYVNR